MFSPTSLIYKTKNNNKNKNNKKQNNRFETIPSEWSIDCDTDELSDAQSDFMDYISIGKTKEIEKSLSELHEHRYVRELVFTPTGRFASKYYSIKRYNKYLRDLVNKNSNINLVIELIKYYNKYGVFNARSHIKFINLIVSRSSYKLVRKLRVSDVNNISNSKFSDYKCLVNLAIKIRNRALRKKIDNQLLGQNKLVKFVLNNCSSFNRFSSLNVEEGCEPAIDVLEDHGIHDIVISNNKIRINNRFFENVNLLDEATVYKETVVPIRNKKLLDKLKSIILNFINLRKKKQFREDIEMDTLPGFVDVNLNENNDIHHIETQELPCCSKHIQPEMMEPSDTIQQQNAGPVVLNALQQDEQTATINEGVDKFWVNNSTSDAIVDASHASRMELLCKRFTWNSNDVANTLLFEVDLPGSVLNDHLNHPAAMMFCQYAYWHGDMKLRIHLNSTPFHVGKLIFSWYYAQRFDGNSSHRNNIASSVQLPNVCYNASVGGDVVFDIPFRNYRSMLCLCDKVDDSLSTYLGTIRCHVFNRLDLNGPTAIDGYIHLSFANSSFTGIVPRHNIEPQMLSINSMIKVAERSLTLIDRVSNMDKPPSVIPPVMYTPQFSDSFSTGMNDVNNVHSLRLDPTGQTQHPSGSSTSSLETSIKNIIRRWGYLRTVHWDKSTPVASNLLSLPVTPEFDYNQYYQVVLKNDNGSDSRVASVLPPVSAICSINAFNRGSLEYKFEFINSRYHTGALISSFTPVFSNVSFDTAIKSYNITMDVGDTNEYVFKVPYINERPYNPRYNRQDSAASNPHLAPIGEMNLFVLNALRNVPGTTERIYINVYIRAGDDFEVAVPVSPLYSVDYDGAATPKPSYIYPRIVSDSIGLATWRYMDVICKDAYVGKYGTGDDNILQMSDWFMPFCVYEADYIGDKKLESIGCYCVGKDGKLIQSTKVCDFKWLARFIVNGDKNAFRYVIFFETRDIAISYARAHRMLVSGNTMAYPDSPTVAQWVHSDPNLAYYYLVKKDKDQYVANPMLINQLRYKLVYNAFIINNVNEIYSDPTTSQLASTFSGMRMFGEKFVDLKDYCRRYQQYGATPIVVRAGDIASMVRIPITPIGLDISKKDNGPMLNINKEGMIPFICSAFRFYRGGLRFKFIITNVNGNDRKPGDSVFYFQHKPDIIPESRDIKLSYTAGSDALYPLRSGYAYAALSTSVNNNITIEVPCYIPTNLLMLQKPDYSRLSEVMHYMMGVVDVYHENSDKYENGNYHLNIHYSFADDMDLSCFIGFPPVLPLYDSDEINTFNIVQPEMDTEASTSHNVVSLPKEVKEKKPEGYIDSIKSKISSVCSKFAKEEIRKEFGLEANKDGTFWDIIKEVTAKYGKEYRHVIVSCLSQCVHCINNPAMTTFVISLVTFLGHLGLEMYHLVPRFIEWFTGLFGNKKEKNSAVQAESADDIKAEKSSIVSIKDAITSSIVEAGACMLGKTKDFYKNLKMPDFSNKLFTNIRFGALTINSIILMFRNLLDVVPKILRWLAQKINPAAWYRWLFFNENKFIKGWIKDVEFVLDPNNRVAVMSQVKYSYHIQMLVVFGRDICAKAGNLSNAHNFRYVYDLNQKLNNLYSEVALTNVASGTIGVEPFCFCIQGDSQVGKTYITKEVAAHCLKAINYQTYDNLFYTRPMSTKHWDGVQNEPVLIYDDFAHVKTDESIAEHIGEFLLLKSKATFTPPRAHLADKGRKYNPLIVALTMNEAFPLFDNVLAEPKAWQQRRDVLIKASFVAPPTHPNAKRAQDLPREVLATYKHASFSVYTHVTATEMNPMKVVNVPKVDSNGALIVVDDVYEMVNVDKLNIEQLKWYLASVFKEKYIAMREEYLKDIEQAKSFYPETDKSFETNMNGYREYFKAIRIKLNAQEKHTMKIAEKLCKNLVCDVCNESANCLCDHQTFNVASVGTLNVEPEAGEESVIMDIIKATKSKKNIGEGTVDLSNLVKAKYEAIFKDKDTLVKPTKTSEANILAILERCVRLNQDSADIRVFLKIKCIHTLLIVENNMAQYTLFEYAGVECLEYDDDIYSIDPAECECKKQKLLDESEYRQRIAKIYANSLLTKQLDYLNVPKSPVLNEKYLRMRERNRTVRDKCLVEIDETIREETWLGKVATNLCKLAIPLFAVTLVFASVACIKESYEYITESRQEKINRVEQIARINAMRAEMIKHHQVSDECLVNQCSICTPQMAYDQNRILEKKNKKIIQPKEPQMASDVRISLDTRLRRNYFFIYAKTDYGTELYCRCLGVRGQYFLAIDHYIDKLKSLPLSTQLSLVTPGWSKIISIHELCLTKLKNSALVVGKLPNTVPMFVDIVKHFASMNMMPNIMKQAALYEPRMSVAGERINSYDVIWHKEVVTLHNDSLYVPHILSNGADNFKGTTVDWYWSYGTSGKGVCGSVLISDMNISSPIIGMHIAGDVSGGRGYAELICADTLELLFEKIDCTVKDIVIEGQVMGEKVIPVDPDCTKVTCALSGEYNFVGVVPPKFAYNSPTKSQCIHSMCYEKITPSTYDIPHLSPRDERFEGSPMVAGCIHHCNPTKDFDSDLLDIVSINVEEEVLANVLPLRQQIGVLTVEQSVCGIPSIPGYDAMEFDTSEGFPFSSVRPKGAKDKRWLFDLAHNTTGYVLKSINDDLVKTMEVKHNQRMQGIVPFTVFTDCLKDLKLPKEKCHKTRIFSVSPVDFTIQFRQYFYDFTIAFQHARLNIESAVGINCDSLEWHHMVQSLIEHSPHFVCGDYSKFGPRLMTKCVLKAFDIICKWYEYNGDTQNTLIRQIMGLETAFAKHLMFNMIYEVLCGAPSGCPLTTILNNLVNMIYIRYVYLLIIKKLDINSVNNLVNLTISYFSYYVKVFFYGDDLIMTVKDDILLYFNAKEIAKQFAIFDIKFTDALKTDNLTLSTSIFDVETSFLKRNIKRHENRPCYVAAMDKRSIEETCNWVFRKHEEPEASIIACESMLLNAFGHGSAYYNHLRERVVKFWRQYNILPRIPTWVEVDWRIYEGFPL